METANSWGANHSLKEGGRVLVNLHIKSVPYIKSVAHCITTVGPAMHFELPVTLPLGTPWKNSRA
ncbi:hypothetical protein GCM10008940_21010 [Microbulbifer agarilyticus]